ncbi:hypothetical protein OUZ56_006980 [Daphnia magna]|uniref:Uncharacterized protein n=1 Tax=Daphnia magna TaxID=35525 RepID=A0ABQ9YX86_9CRUS|nr:hypothetical protein OUZ56_006980 [Daphnia magna]
MLTFARQFEPCAKNCAIDIKEYMDSKTKNAASFLHGMKACSVKKTSAGQRPSGSKSICESLSEGAIVFVGLV